MARITDRDDWFQVWFEDAQSIISTMTRNMVADLEAGYDFFGKTIQKEKSELESYKENFDKVMDMFKGMEEKSVNRWCFYELKKKGAIA